MTDGQTVKTVTVTSALEERFGSDQIIKADTHGGAKTLLKMPYIIINMLKKANNIVIFPAQRGLKIIVPLLVFFNRFYHRRLHYCVIGGWLPELIWDKNSLIYFLKQFSGIYIETKSAKNTLNALGLQNVYVIPNCKELSIVPEHEMSRSFQHPMRVCTFSRVIKEKGIEDAIIAVADVNRKYGKEIYSLDIFGPVDSNQTEWFLELKKSFPNYVKYKGKVEYSQSVDILSGYDLLLFPTYYEGEGFAGTIIDSFFAGTPIVASDWRFNPEIIRDGETGILFPSKDTAALSRVLEDIYLKKFDLEAISCNEKKEAELYLPQNALQPMFDRLTGN